MIRDTSQQDVINQAKAKPLWRRALPFVIAAIASLFVLKHLWAWNTTEFVMSRDDIQLATIERGTITREINSQGKIVAAHAPIIYSPESGQIKLLVRPGHKVEKDQPIAEVTSVELANELKKQQANLKSLQIDFQRHSLQMKRDLLALEQGKQQAKVEWQASEREMQRANDSIGDKLISQQNFERAQDALAKANLAYQHAKQDIEIQRESLSFENQTKAYQVEYQQIVVDELKQRIRELQIRSPVDGMLGNWLVEQSAQIQINQALMTVIDLTQFEAELAISESFADELALDMPVSLSAAGHQLNGRLSAISPEVKNGAVATRVALDNTAQLELRQNQRLTATITLEQKPNVLMVKRGQFVTTSGGKWSYRLEHDQAVRTDLVTGISNLTHIEIVSGVKEGEQIVISSLQPFNDFNTVLIR
ncbi:efflux transporter periplasmic adaptor subunit [Saccharobesus litoralis]|uniref:Efflux transporter periplasmic adaptor subunit n=1 Tax=Saccharobesus litoralis TaxID=2172099 RepID=A0A2S0VQV2_9ALTE|nr:HlyD family efflux transporter periplasmic adaptor subunit [Saccharobesus litoralis]AWB66593.1 efflux transporter periplasmic adaptor subunit [Saccharobesus litoralis]